MSTDHATSRVFSSITSDQKRLICDLIGAPILEDQSVFIMTYTPGKPPSASDKEEAAKRLLGLISKAHDNIGQIETADADLVKDLDEAIKASKSRCTE